MNTLKLDRTCVYLCFWRKGIEFVSRSQGLYLLTQNTKNILIVFPEMLDLWPSQASDSDLPSPFHPYQVSQMKAL